MAWIFISYRRADTEPVADRLYQRLAERFGTEAVFRDKHKIYPGSEFWQQITGEIARSRVALVLIGPQWLTVADQAGRRRLDDPEDYVRREIEHCLQANCRVIPVCVDRASPLTEREVPESLRSLALRDAVMLTAGTGFEAGVARLIGQLEDMIAADEAFWRARVCLERFEYNIALSHLDAVPAWLRGADYQDLREEIQAKDSRVIELAGYAADAAVRQDVADCLQHLLTLWQLKPDADTICGLVGTPLERIQPAIGPYLQTLGTAPSGHLRDMLQGLFPGHVV